MSDPLKSARYSVGRAKHHIAELKATADAFFNDRPYETFAEPDSDGIHNRIKVRFAKPIPESMQGAAFDAVNNLRASLDQAGFAIGRAAGKRGKQAHFPFGDSLANAKSLARRGSKDIPDNIFAVMIAFKPYKGGNDLLWALNKLANANKHEILVPVGAFVGKATVEAARWSGRLRMPPVWDSAKNEMEIGTIKRGSDSYGYFQIAFYVALGEVAVVAGKPAVDVLSDMVSVVEHILMALEAETRRAGLFA